MTEKKGYIIGLVAAIIAISAASCAKEDNTMRYGNATMGNIVDGVFISDQGNIFNVTEQACDGRLDTMKRAFVICDIIQNTPEGAENEYDVRLNHMVKVLEKDAIPVSDIENLETYMNDPLILIDVWFSGGYVNLYIMIPVDRSGKIPHELNLLHEQKDGAYKFIIRHNAQGEIIKEEGNNGNLALAYAYASFPISTVIKEDSAMIEIEWNSYLTSGSIVSSQSKVISIADEYKKGTFEHVPHSAAVSMAPYNIE